MIYIMVLFLDIYIQMKHLLHFLLLILTLLDLLYYNLIFTYLIATLMPETIHITQISNIAELIRSTHSILT